jgi:hypothetical protein
MHNTNSGGRALPLSPLDSGTVASAVVQTQPATVREVMARADWAPPLSLIPVMMLAATVLEFFLVAADAFELAIRRFCRPSQAKAARKRGAAMLYIGGLLIAALVTIPAGDLTSPPLAMSLMVQLHKRLGRFSEPPMDNAA